MFAEEKLDEPKRQSSTTDNLLVIKHDILGTAVKDLSFMSEKLVVKGTNPKQILTENLDETQQTDTSRENENAFDISFNVNTLQQNSGRAKT